MIQRLDVSALSLLTVEMSDIFRRRKEQKFDWLIVTFFKGTNYWRNRILKVAKDNTDFSYAISNKDDFQHEMSEYGLDYVA